MRALGRAVTLVAGLLSFGPFGPPVVDAQAPSRVTLGPPRPGKVQRLTLSGGTQLIGRIVAVTDSTVEFESSLGTTSIARNTIVKVREESPGVTRNGQYYFPHPNATRLFFSPTARMLEQGEGYFADHYIFLPSIAVGVSNRVTFGGGFSVIPEVRIPDQLWYLTPKVGLVRGPDFNLAIGAWVGGIPSDNDHNTAGILYGVGTWGKPDASVTAGLGYGFVNGDLAENPVVVLGGEKRASQRISFVTENYYFPGGTLLWTGGLRFFGFGVSVDFAAVGLAENGGCCAPFLGVLWKW